MKFKFYLVSNQLNKAAMIVVNTELPLTKEEVRRLLKRRTPYKVQEYSIIPAKHKRVFDSLAEALDFLSVVKLVGTTRDCEYITERKKLMSFYGNAPFKVTHSKYNGNRYTFFTDTYNKSRNWSKSLESTIRELFSDYYVGISRFDNPFVPAKIVLEKVGNTTHVYEEWGYYKWVEKEIIAKY